MDEPPEFWRIPRTPIRIARIDHGPREGEFLFTERTTRVAPRFAARIEDMPVRSPGRIESWRELQVRLTGPLIPRALEVAIPGGLKVPWLGTPVWKAFAALICYTLTVQRKDRKIVFSTPDEFLEAYPGLGPEGAMRLAVFATHEDAQIDHLLEELGKALRR